MILMVNNIKILILATIISLAAFDGGVLTAHPVANNLIAINNLKSSQMIQEKKCNKCGVVKLINDFRKKRSICKLCDKEYNLRYIKTKKGLITNIYNNQRHNSIFRKDPLPTYTKQQLINLLFNNPLFHKLYDNWVSSNYDRKLRPSIDRINDYKSYSFDNIQLVTWYENERRYYTDSKNGINNKQNFAVIGINKHTKDIIEFHSMNEASRQIKTSQGNISDCCKNKRKSAGGYIWKLKEHNG